MGKSSVALIAYVPAPHRGYLELFRKHRGQDTTLFVLGSEFIREHKALVRHLPGNEPKDVQLMLRPFDLFKDVRILTKDMLSEARAYETIIMPDEDVSHKIAAAYFSGKSIQFDGAWRLRWDWGATQKNRRPKVEGVITRDRFNRDFMRIALKLSETSPDWWRQVGALLVKDGALIVGAVNGHEPYEGSAYLEGDPRSNFEPGQHIGMSVALHAEAGVIADAARRGISTDGCDLYVSTFPCPACAYLCAHTGIRRLYYAEGYSLVAGAEALAARGVEIIRVM